MSFPQVNIDHLQSFLKLSVHFSLLKVLWHGSVHTSLANHSSCIMLFVHFFQHVKVLLYDDVVKKVEHTPTYELCIHILASLASLMAHH